MMPLIGKSPGVMTREIGARLQARRLQLGWSRKTLAVRAGVNPWSLKRLEVRGLGSVEALVKTAIVLGIAGDLESLFAVRARDPVTLADLEKLHPAARKRGTTLP